MMHIGMPVVAALLLPMPLPVLVASVATSVAAVAVVSAAAVGDCSPVCLSARPGTSSGPLAVPG